MFYPNYLFNLRVSSWNYPEREEYIMKSIYTRFPKSILSSLKQEAVNFVEENPNRDAFIVILSHICSTPKKYNVMNVVYVFHKFED